MPTADQATGRLALLTARASYQVDDGVVNAFRAVQPADADLIRVTAWASFAAMRRVNDWVSGD